MKAARRRSRVALLEQELLQTHPVYGKALSNVRRTALAISEDPTHSWRKAGRGSGQGRRVDGASFGHNAGLALHIPAVDGACFSYNAGLAVHVLAVDGASACTMLDLR